MRQMVISLDAGVKPDDFAKSITISKALYMLKRSVFLVKPSTISNCFSKAGFEVNTESTICAAFNGWLLFLMVLYATTKSG